MKIKSFSVLFRIDEIAENDNQKYILQTPDDIKRISGINTKFFVIITSQG